MMVLVLSFGPVQGFLKAGRKTRDLAWGSRLLSKVVAAAARAVAAQPRTTLVAPAAGDLDGHLPVANKIVAQVPADSVPDVVAAARTAAENALREIADAALGRAAAISVDRPLFDTQVARFLEIVHAAAPLADSFGAARERAERALDGRKALRDFSGYAGRPGRPKASVDGRLESVFNRTALDAIGHRFGPAMFTPSEQLDAMGTVRRLWEPADYERAAWPSTAGIAVSGWVSAARSTPAGMQRLTEADELRRKLNRALRDAPEFEALGGDFSWLLTPSDYSRPTLERFLANAAADAHAVVAELQREFDRGVAKLRSLRPRPPTAYPYYAIVSADGDRVGAALAQLASIEDHQQAVRALAGFAGSVEGLATDTVRVVYAGGDDVLALMPVDDALPFCQRLATEFDRAVARVPWRDGAPTLSSGFAIVHAHDALQAGIELARGVERAAKEDGWNRVGIVLSKRSGADIRLVLPRERLDAFVALATALARGEAPRGLAYELRDLGTALAAVTDTELAIREVKRVLIRKRGAGGQLLTDRQADKLLNLVGFAANTGAVTDKCEDLSAYLRIAAACVEFSQPEVFSTTGAVATAGGPA